MCSFPMKSLSNLHPPYSFFLFFLFFLLLFIVCCLLFLLGVFRCKSNECCETYEHCVSCCLGNSQVEDYMKSPSVYRVALHPETGSYEKRWDYCSGQCRTNPLSTISENRYKDSFHFCYSKYPLPENNYLKLPKDLKVETAMRGQDCDTACAVKGMRCAPEHFEKINLCEIIAEYTGFRCRFCKINSKGAISGGPAVQHTPGVNEMFDGNCIQNKDVRSFRCNQNVVEAYNRICPCMDN